MTVSPPVAVLCTLAQQITSKTSMCPLKDPTRQNKSGQTWPMDKTKNSANNKWDQATELHGRQPLPVAQDSTQRSHRIQSAGRGLPALLWLLVGGWLFARVWSNSWARRRPDLFLSVASCNVTPVRTSMVMSVQFSALVQSQLCPKHWLRLAFRTVNVTVFQRVLACCVRWNTHVICPAREVAILLVKTVMTHPSPSLRVWKCDKFYFSDTDLRRDCKWVFHIKQIPPEPSTNKPCSNVWSLGMSFRPSGSISSRQTLCLWVRIHRLSRTLGTCARIQPLWSWQVSLVLGPAVLPSTRGRICNVSFFPRLQVVSRHSGLERVASSDSALQWPAPSRFHKYQSFISMSWTDSLL